MRLSLRLTRNRWSEVRILPPGPHLGVAQRTEQRYQDQDLARDSIAIARGPDRMVRPMATGWGFDSPLGLDMPESFNGKTRCPSE